MNTVVTSGWVQILLIYYRYEEYIVSLQYAPMFTNTKPEETLKDVAMFI